MNACTVCAGPVESGDLCAGCAAKVKRVRPAGRFVVDRAAQKSMRLASRIDAEPETLIEYILDGAPAGRRW